MRDLGDWLPALFEGLTGRFNTCLRQIFPKPQSSAPVKQAAQMLGADSEFASNLFQVQGGGMPLADLFARPPYEHRQSLMFRVQIRLQPAHGLARIKGERLPPGASLFDTLFRKQGPVPGPEAP